MSALLVRRNREIAEVREDLQSAEKKLETLQVKNQSLLEQRSLLDSEISGHSNRAAAAEMKLAELFDQEHPLAEQLAEQKEEHRRAMEGLERSQARRQELLDEVKRDQQKSEERSSGLEAELRKLQAELDEETALRESVRRQRDTLRHPTAIAGGANPAVQKEIDQLATVDLRPGEEANFGRSQVVASPQDAEDPAKTQPLEATVGQLGGDAAASDGGSNTAEDDEVRLALMHRELGESQEQIRILRARMENEQMRDTQKAERLQRELDDARQQLSASLHDANEAHQNQVKLLELEEEVQAEREQERALEQQSEEMVGSEADREAVESLQFEFQQARAEQEAAEHQYSLYRDQVVAAESRRQEAEARGVQDAAKLRQSLEELWKGLRMVRMRVEQGSPVVASSMPVFNPPERSGVRTAVLPAA